MSRFIAKIKDWALNPCEPKEISNKAFYIGNLALFIVIKCLLIATGKDDLSKMDGFSLWNVWVPIFLVAIIWVALRNWRNVTRFIVLVVYAQNRSMIFRLGLAILIFPIELLASSFVENYMSNGFNVVSITTKAIGYAYFYYLFLRVCIEFIFKKQLKAENAEN